MIPTERPILMKMFTPRSLCSATLLLATVALAGCHSDSAYHRVRGNLTPELQGLHERPVDVDRNMRVAQNQLWRSFSDDLGRVFYTDHPSRLTPMPVVDTSGNPR